MTTTQKQRRKRRGKKSDAIRAYLKDHPQAGPTEVAKALSAAGIKISPMLVSNVKARMAAKKAGGRKGRRRGAGSASGASYDQLIAAKSLVDQVGSIEAAKQALDSLASLR